MGIGIGTEEGAGGGFAPPPSMTLYNHLEPSDL